MSSRTAPVVVGYDGSQASTAALAWAAAEAVREGVALRIAEVFEVVVISRPSPGKVVPLAALRTVRERGLEALAESIRLQNPNLDVQGVLLEGRPAAALIEETVDARMLVLGTRGLGGFAGMLVGSVSAQVATHAHCPVVVVSSTAAPISHRRPTIVVGLDGSKESLKATEFAFEQAEVLHGKVVVVSAWNGPFSTYEDGQGGLMFDNAEILKATEALVTEALTGPRADHPRIQVEVQLVPVHPAGAILDAAKTADLVVVGSRGRGGFAGLLLGSTSQHVLHHANCPVAIVR